MRNKHKPGSNLTELRQVQGIKVVLEGEGDEDRYPTAGVHPFLRYIDDPGGSPGIPGPVTLFHRVSRGEKVREKSERTFETFVKILFLSKNEVRRRLPYSDDRDLSCR